MGQSHQPALALALASNVPLWQALVQAVFLVLTVMHHLVVGIRSEQCIV